jgi:hypothetical protein
MGSHVKRSGVNRIDRGIDWGECVHTRKIVEFGAKSLEMRISFK